MSEETHVRTYLKGYIILDIEEVAVGLLTDPLIKTKAEVPDIHRVGT